MDTEFEQGFFGEAFDRFKELGPKTVRHLYETNKLPDEIERNAAEIWLGRHDRAVAKRVAVLAYLTPSISALTLVVSIWNLVVSTWK